MTTPGPLSPRPGIRRPVRESRAAAAPPLERTHRARRGRAPAGQGWPAGAHQQLSAASMPASAADRGRACPEDHARPHLLDLFSGAGGATRGYQLAGFHVTGIDNRPQPRYAGDHFIQADALEYLAAHGHEYDAIHASPPCQDHSPLAALVGCHGTGHLLAQTRAALADIGVPSVIENVMGADMRTDVRLCGGMFGLRTYRHRQFELSGFAVAAPAHPRHSTPTATSRRRERWAAGWHVSITGDVGTYLGREAMGIDWMTGNELSQAIPPAYTEFVGTQLLAHLNSARGARTFPPEIPPAQAPGGPTTTEQP